MTILFLLVLSIANIWKADAGFGASEELVSFQGSLKGYVECGICSCNFMETKTFVRCKGPEISHIPENLPQNMTHLTVAETRIKVIESRSITTENGELRVSPFYNFTALNMIHFQSNALLEQIEVGAFEFYGASANELESISIVGSRRLKSLDAGVLGTMRHLTNLKVVGCGLTRPPDWGFFKTGSGIMLTEINLSDNAIETLDSESFAWLSTGVVTLSVEESELRKVSEGAFKGLTVKQLKLAGNSNLRHIDKEAFRGIRQLEILDLSGSNIEDLPTAGLEQLITVRLENVRSLTRFPAVITLGSLQVAALTYEHHCCAFAHPEIQNQTAWRAFVAAYQRDCVYKETTTTVTNTLTSTSLPAESDELEGIDLEWVMQNYGPLLNNSRFKRSGYEYQFYHDDVYNDLPELWHTSTLNPNFTYNQVVNCGKGPVPRDWNVQCTPKPNGFNPCEDVMGSWCLRCVVWCVVICALVGNSIVLLVIFYNRHKITVQNFLMCNLAFSDFILGVYLLFLAVVDAVTIERYFTVAVPWQYDGGCQTAGFLSVFATNLSVLTLMVITLERWYAIRHAIYLSKRLKFRRAVAILSAIWLYALLMAILPILGISSYSMTSVCLPMRASTIADQIYLVLMLIVTVSAFIIICYCYLDMYRRVRANDNAAGRNDANIAKKMAVLVFTDFICLFPIALFGLTAALGKPLISVSDSKILLVCFFPLNSCCNPFLYAIFTQQFRNDLFGLLSRCGVCEKQAARYRYTFSSNQLSPSNSRNHSKENGGCKSGANNITHGSNYGGIQQNGGTLNQAGIRPDMGTQTTYTKCRDSAPVIYLNGRTFILETTAEAIDITADKKSQNSTNYDDGEMCYMNEDLV